MKHKETDTGSGGKKVLIVYYSYSGNTRKVAHDIHRVVGGDVVEIEPLEPYPGSYNAVVEQAKQELQAGFLPRLKKNAGDVASYDTVFVGSPNWWHTIAPPVKTFLAGTDLSGKKIIPVVTHGGGGLGRSARDIAGLCPNSIIQESLAVYGADVKAAQTWLAANWQVQQ